MSEANTIRSRSRRCAAAFSALAVAAVLLVGSPNAAWAVDAVETPTPAPSIAVPATSEPAPAQAAEDTADGIPETPKVLPRAVQTIERKAVQTQANGVHLRYTFGSDVYPYLPQINYDGTGGVGPVQDVNEWVDGEGRHLQWNYPMPTDEGHHTVVLTVQLNDTGTLTDYSAQYTSVVSRTGGSLAVDTECAVLYKGSVIDIDDDSPFGCEGSSVSGQSGVLVAGGEVGIYSWADITGTIRVSNVDDSVPKLSLDKGIFGTANQDHRIVMNGTEWYPFDGAGIPVRDAKYATISNGESLTWTASALNSPHKHAEPLTHAQAYFVYEILLDGASSGYWVKGFAENYKSHVRWFPSADCEIYSGDPNNAGTQVAGDTPFTCEPTAMTKPNIKWNDDTTFVVQMAAVDTLNGQVEAVQRGIIEACGSADGQCVLTQGGVEHITAEPAVPNPSKGSMLYANGSGTSGKQDFDFTFSREVTNNFEQMFGVKVGYEQEADEIVGKSKTSIEVSSETTFGYELTNKFDVSQGGEAEVPFWSVGAFYYTDKMDRYSSDVYFLGEGDNWYRATGGTITVPIKADDTPKSPPGALAEPAAAGTAVGAVTYWCTWIEDSADKIVGKVIADYDAAHQVQVGDRTVSNYAEELQICKVPSGWGKLTESAFKGAESKLK